MNIDSTTILNLYKNAFIGQINYVKQNVTYGNKEFINQASSILNEVFLLQVETHNVKFTEKMLFDFLLNRINRVKASDKKTIFNLVLGDKRKLADQIAQDLLNSFHKRFVKGEYHA